MIKIKQQVKLILKIDKISKNNFHYLYAIGKGGFGKV